MKSKHGLDRIRKETGLKRVILEYKDKLVYIDEKENVKEFEEFMNFIVNYGYIFNMNDIDGFPQMRWKYVKKDGRLNIFKKLLNKI